MMYFYIFTQDLFFNWQIWPTETSHLELTPRLTYHYKKSYLESHGKRKDLVHTQNVTIFIKKTIYFRTLQSILRIIYLISPLLYLITHMFLYLFSLSYCVKTIVIPYSSSILCHLFSLGYNCVTSVHLFSFWNFFISSLCLVCKQMSDDSPTVSRSLKCI